MANVTLQELHQLIAVNEHECNWNVFPRRTILTDESLNTDTLVGDFHSQDESRTEEYEEVIAAHIETDRPLTSKNKTYHTLVTDLYEWSYQKSWTFCRRCLSLHRNTMEPPYKTKVNKYFQKCDCDSGRYHVPHPGDFEEGFIVSDQECLRIFEIDTGTYRRAQHGYCQRTGPICAWAVLPLPEERIALIGDDDCRSRLVAKYHSLLVHITILFFCWRWK